MEFLNQNINLLLLGLASAGMYQPTRDLANAICKRFFKTELSEKFCVWCFLCIYSILIVVAGQVQK